MRRNMATSADELGTNAPADDMATSADELGTNAPADDSNDEWDSTSKREL